jgi:hypothetical protein
MSKFQSRLISIDSRSAGLAWVCLALGKTDSKPVWQCRDQEKLSVPISTVIHRPFYR